MFKNGKALLVNFKSSLILKIITFVGYRNHSMKKLKHFIIVALGIAAFSSCTYMKPSIMLKTPKDYNYSQLKDSVDKAYRISPNDILSFRLFSNDGFKLVDITSMEINNIGAASALNAGGSIDYPVDVYGFVKLPVLGRIQLSGQTINEAQIFLEQKYSEYYIKPFVLITVNNRRVIVFPGSDGNARVIPLQNDNTTLLEGLALAGGIYDDGKAWKVKLIRNVGTKQEVYLMDLSKIDGLSKANTILQAGDIIYVEPRIRVSREILNEITPVLSLITSLLLTYALITQKFSK